MIMVGKKASGFTCDAVVNKQIKNVSLSDYDGKYKILFFYPLDFTFVCPTEIHALQEQLQEFKDLNVEVLGISVDSVYSHLAWLNTPKISGGIEGVTFTLLSDIKKTISQDYEILQEDGVALRGVFLLDKENIVQSVGINNLSLGRSIPELIRLVQALQHTEKHGQVCPANWKSGSKSMSPTELGIKEYFSD